MGVLLLVICAGGIAGAAGERARPWRARAMAEGAGRPSSRRASGESGLAREAGRARLEGAGRNILFAK